MRATLGVVTGALALSALAVPAAQADEAPGVTAVTRAAQSAQADAVRGPADDATGDTTISNVVVNGGKPVVLGPTTKKTFSVTFTAKDDSGIEWADVILWHGPDFDNLDGGALANEDESVCTVVNSTTSTCKSTFTVDADVDLLNKLAGTWKVWAIAQGTDADYVQKDNVKSFKIQRATQLTGTNASPEPIKRNKTLTITSKLTRANWETAKYQNFGGQPVKLQFKKKGTSTYTDVKTVTTTSTGALKTTVKATADGYFRYTFAGYTGTGAVTSKSDFVDVQ